jgi:hypothetical protein
MSNIDQCKFWNVNDISEIENKRKELLGGLNNLENKLINIRENIQNKLLDKNYVQSAEYKQVLKTLDDVYNCFSNKNEKDN